MTKEYRHISDQQDEEMDALIDELYGFDDPADDEPDPEDIKMGLAIPKNWKSRNKK